MAGYKIRSLDELGAQARQFFIQSVPGAVASVWANTFTVIGKVLALLDFEHDLRRAWLFKQIFASTADEMWLVRHGYELGLTRAPGTSAFGTVSLPVPTGVRVPEGLAFVRADGATYTSLTPATGRAGSATLYVEADLAGADGNAPAGTTLTLSPDTPVPDGVGGTATVLDDPALPGIQGGIDAESLEAFRARVLARKRAPPHGGSASDYAMWLREAVPSAAGVWVDSFSNDTRSVWVAFTVDDGSGTSRIPTPGEIAVAQAYLDDPLRRPVTARVFVVGLLAIPVPLTIAGLAPDRPEVREAVAAEVGAVFADRAEPGKPTLGPFTLSRSWLDESVSRATGEDRHRLLLPAGDIVFGAGEYPEMGAISYTD
ncbi:baseplate J/gp47 family protein [Methylobacterium aquaticum]|uniref:baseplate J/gp47 family protein n=1 Tax=Methylobacterium aquaticum TaxID=270351 RepID=UPI003D1721E3